MAPVFHPILRIFQYSLKSFQKYEKATGCTLNAHKTKGLLIQTNTVARICQRYPITSTDEFISVLGVDFNNNYQDTKYYNIQTCICQMEKCAKTKSQRNLSLKGKTIVLNTFILSKLWFIADIFPIPKELTPEINKIIFVYLWKGSATRTNSSGNLLSPQRQRRSWNICPTDPRSSPKNKIPTNKLLEKKDNNYSI